MILGRPRRTIFPVSCGYRSIWSHGLRRLVIFNKCRTMIRIGLDSLSGLRRQDSPQWAFSCSLVPPWRASPRRLCFGEARLSIVSGHLNPTAYKQLVPLAGTVGILFVILGAGLTAAGIGWFRRRLWGWRLAVPIIAIQVLGDVVNCIRGDLLRGGIGGVIAIALLLFLLQEKVRTRFA
jgi:hypothetical protein